MLQRVKLSIKNTIKKNSGKIMIATLICALIIGFRLTTMNSNATTKEVVTPTTKVYVRENYNIENSNYKISMDYIVMALGSEPAAFVQKLGLELDKWGNIKIDENYQTSDSKIYACGDLAGIRKTVAWAAYSGTST